MRGSWLRRLITLFKDHNGSISPMLALLMLPMIGAMGMATEASGWFLIQRGAQHAADGAVMAAASNMCDPADTCHTAQLSPSYSDEALAVAAKYSFTNGADNATVTAQNKVKCPSPLTTSDCYQVTITKIVPISLVQIVGYKGNATLSGGAAQKIVATAIASAPVPTDYCILALANGMNPSTAAITLKGAPNANLNGCAVYSNASTDCDGQGGGIGVSTTVGTPKSNKQCGTTAVTGAMAAPDPYAILKSNIPPNCTTGGQTLSITDLSAYTAASPYKVCGPLTINAGTTTLTTAKPGSVIAIMNGGNLILNGTLKVPADKTGGLTIIFSGAPGGSAGFVTGGGTLDFGAPTTGTWAGMAMYQDPRMTTETSRSYAGNSPTFDLTGTLYLPYTDLEIKGAINHQSGGLSCVTVTADTITIKGTGSFFANPTGDCYAAGVTAPQVPNTVSVRQALVQ